MVRNFPKKMFNSIFIGDDIITDGSSSLRMVARDEWLAQPPNKELTDLNLPANRVIIAHSATENCTSQVISSISHNSNTTNY